MDWIFLNEKCQVTDDFEEAEYIFIPSETWSSFLDEYSGLYDIKELYPDTWYLFDGLDYRWIEVSGELLTTLNTIKEELKKNQDNASKVNTELSKPS